MTTTIILTIIKLISMIDATMSISLKAFVATILIITTMTIVITSIILSITINNYRKCDANEDQHRLTMRGLTI